MKATIAAVFLALAAEGTFGAALSSPADARCRCCAALSKTEGLEGKVLNPDEARYTERLGQYYSANAAQAPWCMVFPETAQDVSKIVKVFTEHQCPFGMRAGAHSAFKGSNSIEEGVTVDFGNMNSTTFDASAQVASVQPGSTWGQVYQTLAPYNVVGIGGRADVVGVGGFTTGGGYSFHTGVRGFACDNIVNFEVVLADGSIVNANAQENADLWKSLKGGSGNFGFVTRLDTEVWPSSNIYASMTGFGQDKKAVVIQAYYDFIMRQDEDPASQGILAQTYNAEGFGFGAILSNIHAEVSPSFDEILAIDHLYTAPATGPAHEIVPIFTGPTPLGLFASWQTGMVGLDVSLMHTMEELMREYIGRMKAAAPASDFEMIFQWQPVTQGIVQRSLERGGNVLGLERVVAQGPALMYNIVLTVDTDANQQVIVPIAIEFRQALDAAAAERGLNRDWQFLNYAHGSQDPISHYGADNVAFMQGVSERYDPDQVFQLLRQTGFHLPKGV